MTDYTEEQSNEIEAIESIYPDELTIIQTEPLHVFQLEIKAECTQITDEYAVNCILQFSYTEKYPDEAPLVEIKSVDNLTEKHQQMLSDLIQEQISENLGIVMVFTVVSAVQERLIDLCEETVKHMEEERERLKSEAEAAEQKRFEGTRVTIETFMAWKTKFNVEQAARRKAQGIIDNSRGSKKLTGKELFMCDSTMDDSDVKFLEEDGESVQVDESLFQDLDDLELDDEFADEESDCAAVNTS